MGDDPAIPLDEPVVAAQALDISKHGIRLASVYNVPVGSAVSVVAYYHGQGSVCLCGVVWKRVGPDNQLLYGLFIKTWGRLDRFLEKKLNEMEVDEAKTQPNKPTSGSSSSDCAPALAA